MKTRKTIFGIMALLAILALALITCDNGEETHTHTWGAWEETKAPTVTAEGEETRTCATCGEKETRPIQKLPEQPQFRETTITLTFGENTYTAKVQGTLLEAEWDGVPGKVKSILETAYPTTILTMDDYNFQGTMDTVFARTGVNVIVEKTTAYTNYKIIGDGKTLYLNLSVIDTISVEIIDAIKKMQANGTHSN
jgi:hypothetical protein